MNYWNLYGVTEPTPDPANPPPSCVGQVWVRLADNREGIIVDMLDEDGQRVPYCFGVPIYAWPPEGSILVYGPHAPWQP
jgi:hypothetical protein